MLYPLFLNISGSAVLVVGGGAVAARKTTDLLEAGAEVALIAPELCAELRERVEKSEVKAHLRTYRPGDVRGKKLVIASVDSHRINRLIAEDAKKHGVLCNVVDQPELCDFHVPARVKRGLLQVAISTGGASPAMARRIRTELEGKFGPGYEQLMDVLLELRHTVRHKKPAQPQERRRILEAFLDSGIPELLLEEIDMKTFQQEFEQWKSRHLK